MVLLLVFPIVLSFLDGLKFVVLLIPLGLTGNIVGLLGIDLLRNKQLLLEFLPYTLNRFIGFDLSAIAMLKEQTVILLKSNCVMCENIKCAKMSRP